MGRVAFVLHRRLSLPYAKPDKGSEQLPSWVTLASVELYRNEVGDYGWDVVCGWRGLHIPEEHMRTR